VGPQRTSTSHPGSRRAARERQQATSLRTTRKGVAVATTRTVVLLGLVAGGYSQVAGVGGTAIADEATKAKPANALGDLTLHRPASPPLQPQVDEAALLRRGGKIHLEQVKAAAAAARKRAEAKARAVAEAKAKARAEARARADALIRATREANRNPRDVARLLVAQHGWSSSQFGCLDKLWQKESGWNYRATNASSGAYGIPQALPGSKMSSVASDWRTNATTQIKWGLKYIADRYGTPCGAWSHSVAYNWY
jgi:hypothetical protein